MVLVLFKKLFISLSLLAILVSCAELPSGVDPTLETSALKPCPTGDRTIYQRQLVARSSLPGYVKDNLNWAGARTFCGSEGNKTLVRTTGNSISKNLYILFNRPSSSNQFSMHVFVREHKGSLLNYRFPDWNTYKHTYGVFDYARSNKARWIDIEARNVAAIVYKESGLGGMSAPRLVSPQMCAAGGTVAPACGGGGPPPPPPPPPPSCDDCDREYSDMRDARQDLEEATREYNSATRAVGEAQQDVTVGRATVLGSVLALTACKGASFYTLGIAEVACAGALVSVDTSADAVRNSTDHVNRSQTRYLNARREYGAKKQAYDKARKEYNNCNPC